MRSGDRVREHCLLSGQGLVGPDRPARGGPPRHGRADRVQRPVGGDIGIAAQHDRYPEAECRAKRLQPVRALRQPVEELIAAVAEVAGLADGDYSQVTHAGQLLAGWEAAMLDAEPRIAVTAGVLSALERVEHDADGLVTLR